MGVATKNRETDQHLLATAIFAGAVDRVREFSQSADAADAATVAFGSDVSAADVAQAVAGFDAGGWPVLAVVSGDTLNGAKAAYSAETNTVYVSADFLAGRDRADILAVLVEELGHAVDAKVHAGGDAAGDEGAIFSALVMGETISPTDLSALKLENDHGAIVVDGKSVAVEYATYGTINVDGTINASEWTAAERLDTVGGGTANYAIYGKYVAGAFVFAVQSGVAINANTTFWLNTDQNNATGYKVWGFAAGAEYNVNTSGTGANVVANLYGGSQAAGVGTATAIDFKFNATRTMMEFAVPASALGNTTALNLYADINDSVFIPNSYDSFTYSVSAPVVAPPVVVGDITLDGTLTDWTAANRIDATLGTAGYEVYGKVAGDSYIIALKAPVAIGPNTTAWLNTDQNSSTGYLIWGFSGGAEYNVNFTAASKPQLYSGADGATLVNANLPYFFSADKTIVEFAIPKSMIGSPSAINTMFDINNTTFLSSNYTAAQYAIATPGVAAPKVGATTLDGALTDWTPTQRIDASLGTPGYEVYGKIDGGYFVFALKAPAAIGGNTTAWFNTDLNPATGYQIFPAMGPESGGAEFNINFDAGGIPRLYTGADGQNAVDGVTVLYGYSADKSVVEFAIAASAIGGATATNVLFDINNTTFLPSSFFNQYVVAPPPPPSGDIDGSLADWTQAQRIDASGGAAGYEVYGKATATDYVVAIKAPVAIGAGTTAWLNADQNPTTGFQVFGNAIGAEYNINFDTAGKPQLFTGDAGANLVAAGANLAYAYSADRTIVEFAIPKALIDAPFELNLALDINNTTFLPSSFASAAPYEIVDKLSLPARTDATKKVAIVYSETTAKLYFGLPDADVNKTGYSQLFMAAQNQAAAAGIPFDILTEADLKNISKLANYDTIVFPSFRDVNKADYIAIQNTLELAVEQYKIGLIAAGDFMTNDELGAVLPGDPYARMKEFFDITRTNGGTANVALKANAVTHTVMEGYAANELIRNYTGVGWQTFSDATPGVGPAQTVLDVQTVGTTNHNAVIASVTGGRNVHFATESFLGDNNQLQKAIQWSVEGDGVQVGLQMSRNASIFAGRNDMDQAQYLDDVRPLDELDQPIPNGGIYDKLMPLLDQWKTAYNFVGSYYFDVGDGALWGGENYMEGTDWSHSLQYYLRLLDAGNEVGSHSFTHLAHMTPSEDTNTLVVGDANTPGTFAYEFERSRDIINEHVGAARPGWAMTGAAVPGAPERLPASLEILKYYEYLSGGYSSVGAGYPGAIGYILPGVDKIYIAPNMKFDFTLVEFEKLTPAQALVEWKAEFDALAKHSDLPVIVWPWHDYAAATWSTPGDVSKSPYTTAMFTDFLAYANSKGTEFVTLEDLARRIVSFEQSKLNYSIAGNVVTVTVNATDAGKFAVDLDGLGTQKIVSVAGWYAYDDDSVFLPRNGGTYAITLGAAATEITHIIELPMRSELVSLTGDGRNLSFTITGEGKIKIDLQTPGSTQAVVSGAAKVSQVGDILTLDLGAYGTKSVTVTLGAATGSPPVVTSNGGGATAAINFAENGAGNVTTVTATNSSGGALAYAIVGGADADKFAINTSTGALTFRAAPDFEAPTDADPNNVYDVVVQVTNALNLFDEQAIAVTVTNVAGATYNGTTGNDTFNGTAEDDTANGNNGNDTLNGLAGNDTLNGNAGTDTLNGGDGNDVLNGGAARDVMTGGAGADRFVFSTAADAGNTAAARDVINDFTPGTDKIDLALIDSNTTVAGIQTFTLLPAAGQAFTAPGQLRYYYETIGGVEHTIIEGNTTGAAGSEFMIDLVGRHTLTGTDFIGVQVISGPVAPVISSNGGGDAGAISTPENGTAVTTVAATDLNGDAITYSISGGADAGKFSINATTGVLVFLTAPDFEIPGDVGANNVYDVIVQASDGTLVDTQALAVTITNVLGTTYNGTTGNDTFNGTGEDDTANGANGNDTLNGLAGNDTLNGNAGTDTLNGGDGNDVLNGGAARDVMQGGAGTDRFVFSTAAETGNTAAARDVINDFTPGLDKIDLSAIDANTGVTGNQNFILLPTAGQAFTGPGQLRYYYETIGGVEHTIVEGNVTGANGSEFMIDLVGRHTLAASDFIGVDAVTGAQAPVISSNGGGATAAVSVPENGVAVATVTATDLNGDAITYAINGGADAARFSINATTGALAFLTGPDFEIPGDVGANNVYDVIVQASDGALVDTQALAVTVTNVDGPTQTGTSAANTMNGTNEQETMSGAGGNDTLNGLGGNDTLNGGDGNDSVNGGDGNDTINGDAGVDTLHGDAGNDTINGGAGNDFVYGDAGDDTLSGGDGVDTIVGGDGADRIIGGAGNDTLTGGAGADTFVFASNAEIGNGTTAGSRDTITDFQIGIDKIDLSAIDANASASGNQAFTLLATAGANFTAPGQIRFAYETISGVVHTIIEGNTTGNTGAEFRLDLVGQLTLTSADFLL